ncbi:MAG TPA: hypothetical protein V6D47_19505 [Oscillatoriaceae cyanobacterium]
MSDKRQAEKSEINVKLVFLVGLGILLLGAVMQLGLWGLMQSFMVREGTAGMGPRDTLSTNRHFSAHAWAALSSTPPTPPMANVPPMPREPLDPPAALAAEQARERAEVGAYRMVDAAHGVVKIPIERAMALLAQRGLPSPKPAEKKP